MMCTSRPEAAAASATAQGSAPPPAIMASGPMPPAWLAACPSSGSALVRGGGIVVRDTKRPVGARPDEIDDLLHQRIGGEHLLHVLEPLHQRALAREQHAIGLAQLVNLLAGKAVALETDD